jgi:hypothetical protein
MLPLGLVMNLKMSKTRDEPQDEPDFQPLLTTRFDGARHRVLDRISFPGSIGTKISLGA